MIRRHWAGNGIDNPNLNPNPDLNPNPNDCFDYETTED
jgi:hypothetical protein